MPTREPNREVEWEWALPQDGPAFKNLGKWIKDNNFSKMHLWQSLQEWAWINNLSGRDEMKGGVDKFHFHLDGVASSIITEEPVTCHGKVFD